MKLFIPKYAVNIFKNAFTRTFIVTILLLILFDLGSKYIVTQNLNFHLTNTQKQAYRNFENRNVITPSEKTKPEIYSLIGNAGKILRLKLYFNDRSAFSHGSVQDSYRLIKILFINFGLVLSYVWFFNNDNSRLSNLAWKLIIAGSISNFLDRLFTKSLIDRSWNFNLSKQPQQISGVTDFIDTIWFGQNISIFGPFSDLFSYQRWPIFNFADIFLFVGLVFLLYHFIKKR